MKKLLLPILIVSLLAAPVAPAYATDSPDDGPCSGKIRDMQIDHSRVQQVKDHATMHQIVEQPRDTGNSNSGETNGKPLSNINLACFDQALRLSSLLSTIFSNLQVNINPQIQQSSFCGVIQYPSGIGFGNTPSLSDRLKNILGAWKPNFAQLLMSLLPSGASSFRICTPPMNFQLPHLSLGGSLGGCLPNLNLGGGNLSPFKPTCVGITLPTVSCSALGNMWKGGNKSTEGNGSIPGKPYMNLQQFLNATQQTANNNVNNLTNVGTFFQRQMNNNQSSLTRALNNLVVLRPGHIPSWPTTPHFSATGNVQDIINGM